MEILQFKNNVEVVEIARQLLTDKDNPYPYCIKNGLCFYREPGVEGDKARRCIFGRLMYGHIPEDSWFWKCRGSASDSIHDCPEIKRKFPWMSMILMDNVQSMHDACASGIETTFTWEHLLVLAKEADQEFQEKK